VRAFYDAMTISRNPDAYAEVLLTSDESLTQLIKARRLPHWAVVTLRVQHVPDSLDDETTDADAISLYRVLTAAQGRREFRYGRVMLVRGAEDPHCATTIDFIQKWLPRLREQRRVFLAEPKQPTSWDEILYALGAAEPL
jgi:hypothetical protein